MMQLGIWVYPSRSQAVSNVTHVSSTCLSSLDTLESEVFKGPASLDQDAGDDCSRRLFIGFARHHSTTVIGVLAVSSAKLRVPAVTVSSFLSGGCRLSFAKTAHPEPAFLLVAGRFARPGLCRCSGVLVSLLLAEWCRSHR